MCSRLLGVPEPDNSDKKTKASKKKAAKKVIKFPADGMMQAHGSSAEEEGVDSAHKFMKKFMKKSEE